MYIDGSNVSFIFDVFLVSVYVCMYVCFYFSFHVSICASFRQKPAELERSGFLLTFDQGEENEDRQTGNTISFVNIDNEDDRSVRNDGNVLTVSNTISVFERRTTICSSTVSNVVESVANRNATVAERASVALVAILTASFELIVRDCSTSRRAQFPRRNRPFDQTEPGRKSTDRR